MSAKAKPVVVYAVKRGGVIDIDSLTETRADLIRNLNRPAGESVIKVRVTEVVEGRKP